MTQDVAFFSSGGKDSLLALAALRPDSACRVTHLVSIFDRDTDALMMHRVPRALVASQAASLGLALLTIELPAFPPNAIYEQAMADLARRLIERGVEAVAFGDLHLEDVRAYRERVFAPLGLATRFPLWGRTSREIAETTVRLGYDARIVCVDTRLADGDLAGRRIDRALIDALPASVDPAGERGEFHSFVVDGPGFAFPVPCEIIGFEDVDRYRYARLALRDADVEHCSACGVAFTCGAADATKACWCVAEPIVAPDPARGGCLCPRCLRGLATARSARDPRSPRDP